MPRIGFNTNLRSNKTQSWYWFGNKGGSSTPIADHDHCHEIVNGVNRRKPTGWIPPTNYFFERVKWRRAEGTSRQRQWYPSGTLATDWKQSGSEPFVSNTLNMFDEMYHFSGHSSALRDQALIRARLAMKRGDLNLGVAFAEANKTAKLVGDTALQLARSMRALKRGDFAAAGRALGLTKPGKPKGLSVPSRWLELQYGWKPLLSDVKGSVDALAERPSDEWIITGKGHAIERIDVDHEYDPGSTTNQAWRGSVKGMRGCFVRIDAIPENDLLLSLASLGLTNPALIGWELVPFSFVVDWFLPIGSYLESLDAMLGYGQTDCSISQLARADFAVSGVSQPQRETSGGYTIQHDEDWSGYKRQVYLERTASKDVPLPTLPRLKDPSSLNHMANGLALLATAFGR